MRCPKCSLILAEYFEECPECQRDLRDLAELLGPFYRPRPELFPSLVEAASLQVGEPPAGEELAPSPAAEALAEAVPAEELDLSDLDDLDLAALLEEDLSEAPEEDLFDGLSEELLAEALEGLEDLSGAAEEKIHAEESREAPPGEEDDVLADLSLEGLEDLEDLMPNGERPAT